ncbi:MAG: beta strand repeat-containing protein, partial [Solirubrobacteraceae bacterium]
TLAGQTVQADSISFTSAPNLVEVSFTNLGVSLGGGLVTESGGAGTLDIVSGASGGIYGEVTGSIAINVPNVTLSGTVDVQFNTTNAPQSVTVAGNKVPLAANTLAFSATNVKLTVANQTVGGNFTFTQATVNGQQVVTLGISDLTLQLGSFVNITAANHIGGAVIITSTGVAGTFNGNANGIFNLPTGVTLNLGTFSIAFNSDKSNPANSTVTVGGNTYTIVAPVGPYLSISEQGASLVVDSVSIGGNFTFTEVTPSGATSPQDTITLSNISVTIGPVSLTQGFGVIVVTPAGGGVYGEVGGTVSAGAGGGNTSIPGVTFSGSFTLELNTTASAQSITPPGASTAIDLASGAPTPYVQFSASGLTMSIGPVQISGNFTFTSSTVNGVKTDQLVVSQATFTLTAGTTTILQLGGGTGTLTVTSAGIYGSFSAQVVANAASGIFTLNTVSVALNTTNAPEAGLGAGPALAVQADGVVLNIGGAQLTANLAFQASQDSTGATVIAVVVSQASLSLGSVGTVTGSGALLITDGTGGLQIAASLSATVALTVPGVSLSGTFTVEVNSTGAAVADSFAVAGQTVVLSLPLMGTAASPTPYIQVTAQNISLILSGNTITVGQLTLTVTGGATPTVSLTLADGSLSLGGGAVVVSAIQGSLSVSASDVSGSLSGTVAINAPGVSISAQTVSLTVDTATSTVSASASDLSVTIAGQQITGNFAFSKGTDALGNPAVLVAFTSVTGTNLLSLGGGAVVVGGGDGQLVISSAGIAGSLTATGVAVTLPGVTVKGGTFTIQASTYATAIDQPFTVAGTTSTLSLPAGPYVSVVATGLDLTIGPVDVQGSFAFSRQTATDGSVQTVIAATGVTVTAGPASLTGGQGAFLIGSTGIAGILTGTASVGDSSGGVGVS